MTICCDPADFNLRDASFRGVPFYVDNDKGTYGRRIAVHEFPDRDDPFYEDLGEKAANFSVKAYIACDDGSAKDAIIAACTTYGPAILVLPAEQPLMARCATCTVTRSKDKIGWYEIQMEFHREGSTAAGGSTDIFDVLIDDLMDDAEAAIGGAYATDFSLANGLGWLENRALDRFQNACAVVIATVEANPVNDDTIAASLTRDSTIAYGLANTVIVDDGTYPSVSALKVLIGRLGDVLAPVNGYPIFTGLCSWSSVPPTTTFLGVPFGSTSTFLSSFTTNLTTQTGQLRPPSDLTDQTNELLTDGAVRIFAFIQACRAAAQVPFTTRSQAIQARATIAETAYQLQLDNSDYVEIVNVVTLARDYAIKAVTAALVTLNPVVTLTLNDSMPSLYLAWRLYKDPTRAQELIDRNDVAMPSFMPVTFEALTS